MLAPTSEGKTYAVVESLQYFPDKDVLYIGKMSTMVLVRQKGIFIDKETGQPIQNKIQELKTKSKEIRSKMKDTNEKKHLKDEIEKISEQISNLYENSKILIDLTGKILVFLEPPHHDLWNLLKPILSHDKKEIDFPFVDKTHKTNAETKEIVVRGWPSRIFCSAKDESKWEIWTKIKSRILVTSPNMIPKKYEESNKLIAQRKGLPNLIQKQIIISDDEVETTKKCILLIKQKINQLKLSSRNGKISLWIPYYEVLQEELPANKGTDVRFTNKIFALLNVVPIVKHTLKKIMRMEGEASIIADLHDLNEVLSITQNYDGLPKFKVEFFNDIFLPCFSDKTEKDSKKNGKGEIIKEEEIMAVTSKELCDYFKENRKKPISTDNLKHTYLNQLINEGLIDYTESKIHGRQNIYYPIVTDSLSIESIINPIDYKSLQNSSIYEKIREKITKEWIFRAIMRLLHYRLEQTNYLLFNYITCEEKFQIWDNNQQPTEANSDRESNLITIGGFVEEYDVGSYSPIDNKPSPILLDFAKRSQFLSILDKIDSIDKEDINLKDKAKNDMGFIFSEKSSKFTSHIEAYLRESREVLDNGEFKGSD